MKRGEHQEEIPELSADARTELDGYRGRQAMPREVKDRLWSRLEQPVGEGADPEQAGFRDPERKSGEVEAQGRGGAGAMGLAIAAGLILGIGFWIGEGNLQSWSLGAGTVSEAPRSLEGREQGGRLRGRARTRQVGAQGEVVPVQPTGEDGLGVPSISPGPEGPSEDLRGEQHEKTREVGKREDRSSAGERGPVRAGPPRPRSTSSTGGEQTPTPEPGSAAAPGRDLAEETELLRRAREALRLEKPREARRWLERHAERFSGGMLTEERDALEAMARCAEGTEDPAAVRKKFQRQHPGSPLMGRVQDRCATP